MSEDIIVDKSEEVFEYMNMFCGADDSGNPSIIICGIASNSNLATDIESEEAEKTMLHVIDEVVKQHGVKDMSEVEILSNGIMVYCMPYEDGMVMIDKYKKLKH